jgi:hypothetical protein
VQPGHEHEVRREVLHAFPRLRRVSGGGGLVSRGGFLEVRRDDRMLMRGEGLPLFAQSPLYGLLVVSGAMGGGNAKYGLFCNGFSLVSKKQSVGSNEGWWWVPRVETGRFQAMGQLNSTCATAPPRDIE